MSNQKRVMPLLYKPLPMNPAPEKHMTSKSYMRALSTIYLIMILGVLLFAAFSYLQGGNPVMGFSANGDIWVYIVPLIAMISYFGGNFIFNRVLSNIPEKSSLKEKLAHYMRAGIIRYALLEGAAFIGAIAYWDNNNIFYLVIVASLILYLFKLRPTKGGVIRDLRLEGKDLERFRKDREEIQ